MRSKALIYLSIALIFTIFISIACSFSLDTSRLLATPTAQVTEKSQKTPQATQAAGSTVKTSPAPDTPTDAISQTQADPTSQPTPRPTPASLDELFKPFWQAWKVLHEQFYGQLDDYKLMEGAIRGMMEAAGDKHTSYMAPSEFQAMNAQLQGEQYEGIGAWVDTTQEFLTIISPMPGSPAETAGLKPGDRIVAVDGNDMTGVNAELVRQKVLGPRGSKIRLTILRKGVDKPFDVEVERRSITPPSIEYRMLDSKVAYIHLFTFGDKTTDELHTAISELLPQKPVGLILDLRNNGGGYLDTAVGVGSEFIKKGNVILYEEYGDGEKNTFKALSGGLATEIPMVVLINEGTASASEIVSGAIQDYGRGQLIGVKSYGKGSVQMVTTLDNGEGGIRVTIAHWLTPKERQINEIGLQPDIEVKISDEDIQAGKDPQLDKAIEVLTTAK